MLKLVSVLPIPSLLPHFWKDVSLVILASQRLIFFLPAALWTLLELLSMALIFLPSKKLEECKKRKKKSSRIFYFSLSNP